MHLNIEPCEDCVESGSTSCTAFATSPQITWGEKGILLLFTMGEGEQATLQDILRFSLNTQDALTATAWLLQRGFILPDNEEETAYLTQVFTDAKVEPLSDEAVRLSADE